MTPAETGRADALQIVIDYLCECCGIPVSADVESQIDAAKPGNWPTVTVQDTGGRVGPGCIGGGKASPFEEVTIQVDVYGRLPDERSTLTDPNTGEPYRSPHSEIESLASRLSVCLETIRPWMGDTGFIQSGRIVQRHRRMNETKNGRPRRTFTARVQVRSKWAPVVASTKKKK